MRNKLQPLTTGFGTFVSVNITENFLFPMSAYVKTKYSKMIRIIITPSLNKSDFVPLDVDTLEYQKNLDND